jgi:hypothetical protein
VHFANLNNAAAEDHFKNLRDMQKATMETNKVLQSQKEDNERNAKMAEQQLDRYELQVAR